MHKLFHILYLQENECIETVKIAQKWHGLIIGPNGEHMKDIRDRFSSVHVAFPEKGERCDSVTLRGPKEEVRQCAAHLKKQAADIVRYDIITYIFITSCTCRLLLIIVKKYMCSRSFMAVSLVEEELLLER